MYKLKESARAFFPSLATDIKSAEFWELQCIHQNLLDKVPNAYVEFGHKRDDITLGKFWSSGKEATAAKAEIPFTLHIKGISLSEFEEVNISRLTDKFQKIIDEEFVEYNS